MLGAGLGLVSGLLFAAGNFAQKRAVDSLPTFSLAAPLRTMLALIRSWVWIVGALLSVLGIVTQLVAYRRASIAVVQVMCVFGIIALLTLPRIAFGEHLSRRESLGVVFAVIAFGLVVGSIAGAPNGVGDHLVTARTELVVGISVVAAAVVLGFNSIARRSPAAVFGLASGLLYGSMGLGVKAASATFASSGTVNGLGNLFRGPIPYTVAACWIAALLIFQIGIQRGRLSIVAPLSSITSTIYVIAAGTPLFNEAWPHSAVRSVMRIVGLVAILVGLAYVLTPEELAISRQPVRSDTSSTLHIDAQGREGTAEARASR